MSADNWIVVETLGPEGPRTVVVDGDKPRNWSSLNRARSGRGADVSGRMADVVETCVETKADQVSNIPARSGRAALQVRGVPIFGASGRVHGVHVWVGRLDEDPPERRGVWGWDWDADAELAYQGPGLETAIHGLPSDQQKVVRTPSENFQSVVRFDDRLGYLGLCENVHGGGKWQGEITFNGIVNGLHQLQMIARATTPGHPKIVRGLFHEISDIRAPEPMVESSVLRAVARASGDGVALIATNLAVAYDWLSTPAPPLDPWIAQHPETHPEDADLLEQECLKLTEVGQSARFTMRVRFTGLEWIATDVSLVLVSNEGSPHGLMTVKPILDG